MARERRIGARFGRLLMPDRWQPIATAPRNGDRIMLWCQGQCYANAFWETLGDDEPTWYAHVPAVKEPVRLDGATCWMPVPGPPEPPMARLDESICSFIIAMMGLAFIFGLLIGGKILGKFFL